jgi:outer membrane protein OmpA-like peptidoglycan-associated protein
MTDTRTHTRTTQTRTHVEETRWRVLPVNPLWDWLAPLLLAPIAAWGLTGNRAAIEATLAHEAHMALAAIDARAGALDVSFVGRDGLAQGPGFANADPLVLRSAMAAVPGVRAAEVNLGASPAPAAAVGAVEVHAPTDRGASDAATAAAVAQSIAVRAMATAATEAPAGAGAPPAPALPPITSPEVKACQDDVAAILAKATISFETASAALTADGRAVVTRLADVLRRCPEGKAVVEGHTDDRGEASENQELSVARAASVIDALAAEGLDRSRFIPAGKGESEPIADNNTEAGRASNRRTVFRLGG